MKIKKLFLLIFLISLPYCKFVYAEQTYQEKTIPQGKIIFGMREEEALNKYGLPASIKGNIWCYNGLRKLYIYLDEPLEVYLYPRFIKGYVDFPLELKVLAGPQEITDVTSKVELLLSNPGNFTISGQGVLVPKKPGDYQIIAKYKGCYSNASFISVAEAEEDPGTEERLINIDIFPYKPYVDQNTTVYFQAFGTFVFKGRYTVREITRQAEWFSEQNGQALKIKDSKVVLRFPGKYKVFCRHKGLQSISQDIEVAKIPVQLSRSLKQISIVPADVFVTNQSSISFYAFATYGDNRVEEVSKRIGWVIKDTEILERVSDNVFAAKFVGITELQGVLDNLRSLPVKVAVSDFPVIKARVEKAEKQKNYFEDSFDDIKVNIKDLTRKFTEEKKFKSIRISPDYCDIPAGAQKQFSAFGLRQDNLEEDITILANWKIIDGKFADVKNGLINAIAPGDTKVCVKYKNIENQCIPVIVREARLISMAVSPAKLMIAKGEHLCLEAEGHFGDSSHRDITSLVSWVCADSDIVKMDKNKVWPAGVGRTKIFAEYLGMRSLPVEAEVVHEKHWLFKLILKILLFLLLAVFLSYSYFYILTEKSKRDILSLYSSPRDLTIALYMNLSKIVSIFGIQHRFYMPPLFLAGLADGKYAIKDNLFLRFAQQYEEAKYSSHIFPPGTSRLALDEYNHILKIVFAQHKKRTLAVGYLRALISGTPFFIYKIKPS